MQKRKGISLIVLVITIIVMAILAGAIILTLNNSGIIGKASEAVEITNLVTVQELAAMKWSEAYIGGKRTQLELESAVLESLEEENIDLSTYFITVTQQGVEVQLLADVNVIATVDGVPIPKGFVASQATGENLKAKGLVIYEGSEAVTDTNVGKARMERNQYVWVPVDTVTFDATFVRNSFNLTSTKLSNTLGDSSESMGKYWEVLPTTELSAENLKYMTEYTLAEVQAMYTSVKKYGGFYIARYEAGVDVQRTEKGTAEELPGIKEGTKVYSVMGKIPYTFIPWTWNDVLNEETNGAVEVSRNMYPETNINYGVVSTLVYGVQWDRTVEWIIDTKTMTLEQVTRAEGSTAFGNYKDHVINTADELNEGALVWDYTSSSTGSYVTKDSNTLTYPKASGTKWALSTGALKAANINNIYDMAGNLQELIMEGKSQEYGSGIDHTRTHRGGSFVASGNNDPLSFRYYYSPEIAGYNLSFRIALYIK